ncbi:MAG: hypothetical protein LC722_06045 [Actinobacteria bacterium]|nr:hypothetical protein [Actinomycetota bacterium]
MAKRRRTIRRWERTPQKIKKRRVQRAVLGAGMGAAAWVIEKRILKGLKKKGLDDEFRGAPNSEGFQAATAERAED